MHAQGFPRRQPRAPEAETRVAPHPLCLRRPARPPVLGLQTAQRCGELLQMPEGLPDVRPLGRRVRRRPRAALHDRVHGEGLLLHLLPEPAQRRQGQRGGVQGPADAPLPAGDPPPQRLFLGKAEQRKPADLTQIPREHLIRRRVSRVVGCRRRSVVLYGGLCRGSLCPGGRVRDQRPADLGMCDGSLARLVVLDRVEAWERSSGFCGAAGLALPGVWFVHSSHTCMLLTRRSPGAGTRSRARRDTHVGSRLPVERMA